MSRLCTICARGGSKGIPGKNLRLLSGKPLLVYSVEQALASGLFDAIAVSSDSAEILEVARLSGVDHLIERPAKLATDTAAKLPVIRHCVAEVERERATSFDVIVDLDVTAPMRSDTDIREAVTLLEESGAGNVITGSPARKSPYFNLVEVNVDGLVELSKPPVKPIVRRQDAPQCYDMNASIYVWRRESLFGSDRIIGPSTRLHVMEAKRSIDIDSELDFEFVEFVMSLELKSPRDT